MEIQYNLLFLWSRWRWILTARKLVLLCCHNILPIEIWLPVITPVQHYYRHWAASGSTEIQTAFHIKLKRSYLYIYFKFFCRLVFFGTGSYLLSQTLLLSWCNSSFQFWHDVQEGIKNELALFGSLGSNTSWRVTEKFYMKMVTKLTMWLLHFVTGFHPHKENKRNSAISP